MIHFQDARPPQEVQFELERELMELFQVNPEEPKLTFRARVLVSGIPHELTLRFEEAHCDRNSYSLRIQAVELGSPLLESDTYRKSLESWFGLWTRNFKASAPSLPGTGSTERYRELVDTALKAEAHLIDVRSIQLEILRRMREGASFSTAHKEGGTIISFNQGRFVRADYGESSGRDEFQDPDRFLAFLRQFYDWQTSQNVYPNKVSDEVAWKLILRLLQRERNPNATVTRAGGSRSPDVGFLNRYRRLRMILGMVILVGTIVLGIGYKALRVRTVGMPFGEGCGTPDFIAVLVERQEPYIPSLQRNPNNDRFHIHLLLQPRDGNGARRLISLQNNLRASESRESTRILGFDGKLLWVLSREILAYDYRAEKVIRLEDLRRANPSLETLWPQGYYEVIDRLRVSTRDRTVLVEIEPETLVAKPVSPSRGNRPVFPPHPVNSYLSPSPSSDPARLDQSLIRDSGRKSALKLSNPDGQLLAYWQKTNLFQRRFLVARVDSNGKTVWETDTGIGELQQIFPDSNSVAFLGTRPRVPDKLPEPVFSILRNDSGVATVHSLWIRD